MPIAIHWDWEGHSTSKPLQSSCVEALLACVHHTAAACAVQIFAVFIFEYGVSIQNIQKFPQFENFPLYSIWYACKLPLSNVHKITTVKSLLSHSR